MRAQAILARERIRFVWHDDDASSSTPAPCFSAGQLLLLLLLLLDNTREPVASRRPAA
jgi:hypothetical protein